MMAYSGRN